MIQNTKNFLTKAQTTLAVFGTTFCLEFWVLNALTRYTCFAHW